MLIKYCEAKHNLAKECTTIGLGTLQSYADDDPNFLRHDCREGAFTIANNGVAVEIDGQSLAKLTSGSFISPNGMSVEDGGRFSAKFQFPNCYIFCLSQSLPNKSIGEKIDKAYDDFYCITDIRKFILCAGNLLRNQLSVSDFELSENVSLEWLRGLNIQVVHRQCSYTGREFELSQESVRDAANAAEDSLRWAFSKGPDHSELQEYRILFLVVDSDGQIVPVKKNPKVLKLLPDLGISTIELTKSE